MARRKKKMVGVAERPRLVVYRSLKYIHAQLVDDTKGQVLLGISNKSKIVGDALKDAKTKVEQSYSLGKLFAEEAKKKNITNVVFDRNGYIFHGRVKAFADGAREGGLDF
jgi:large subunit ribosomal protein L18